MLTTEMSPIIAAAQAGDTIVVRHAGGRPTPYKVRSIGGKKARELKLEGRRGSMRVLVDGGDQIWIREASARANDGSAHRRVMELHIIGLDIRDPKTWTGTEPSTEIEREMAIREAGLPPGYDIELHPRGFQPMLDREPAGPVNANAFVAACTCWKHWADRHADESEHDVLRLAGLPPGYDVKGYGGEERFGLRYGPGRKFLAVLDEPTQPVISPREREHAVEAVVDAWAHHAAKRELVAAERWTCIVERAQADERLLLDLPRGYTIVPGDPGFYRAVFDDAGWVGAVRTAIPEAVVDALIHAREQLEAALSRHRTTGIDRDVAKSDASRCRRALRQIREIAKGLGPTGKELSGGEMPEQVAAEVGHALRVESKKTARDEYGSWMANASDVLAWAVNAPATADRLKDPAP